MCFCWSLCCRGRPWCHAQVSFLKPGRGRVCVRIDWRLAFLCPVFKTHSFPPSESCPVYLIHALRAHLFFLVNDSSLCHQQAHAWAYGVGTPGPRTCPVMKFSVCCCIAHVLLRASSVSAPLLHQQRRHRPQDGVLYLDLCCSQHAETCYLHRVRVCVLQKFPGTPRFRSHFRNDWTSGWRLMDFEPVLPVTILFLLLSKSACFHNTLYSFVNFWIKFLHLLFAIIFWVPSPVSKLGLHFSSRIQPLNSSLKKIIFKLYY